MCSITILPRGVRVSPEIMTGLRNAAEVNTDGAGFGIVTDGYVVHQRSMDSKALTAEFALARETWHDGVAVIHYRLATAKKPAEEHLHPFESGSRYLFFNGSLPHLEQPERSDARVLAEDYLPELSTEDLDALIGPYNKAVVLWPTDGHHQYDHYVASQDQWLTGPQETLWSSPDFMGKDLGWDEARNDDGDLLRWSKFQPGQCMVCHRFRCEFWESGAYEPADEGALKVIASPASYRLIAASRREGDHCEPAPTIMPRWRNETARIAGLS